MKRPLLLVLTLMLGVVVVGCNSSKRKSSENAVAKVEQFRKSNGASPNALSDVGTKEDESCPCYCKMGDDSYIVWYGPLSASPTLTIRLATPCRGGCPDYFRKNAPACRTDRNISLSVNCESRGAGCRAARRDHLDFPGNGSCGNRSCDLGVRVHHESLGRHSPERHLGGLRETVPGDHHVCPNRAGGWSKAQDHRRNPKLLLAK